MLCATQAYKKANRSDLSLQMIEKLTSLGLQDDPLAFVNIHEWEKGG